jgi:hypothetical protein
VIFSQVYLVGKMKKTIVIIVFVLFGSYSLFSNEASTKTTQEDQQKDSTEPGYREHDGFYFRFLLNPFIGYGFVHSTQNEYSVDMSDTIANVDFQLGFSLNKNISLFVSSGIMYIPPLMNPLNLLPKAINADAQRGARPNSDTGIFQTSAGLTYYFIPNNIYLSLSLEIVTGGVTIGNFHSVMDDGFGIQTSIGKEWWVSKNWGLGIALNLSYDFFPTTRAGYPTITPLHAFMVGLSFSATYN